MLTGTYSKGIFGWVGDVIIVSATATTCCYTVSLRLFLPSPPRFIRWNVLARGIRVYRNDRKGWMWAGMVIRVGLVGIRVAFHASIARFALNLACVACVAFVFEIHLDPFLSIR